MDDKFTIRQASSSEVTVLYDFLNEYVVDQGLENEFRNSKTRFERHFEGGLFQGFLVELEGDETRHRREAVGCLFYTVTYEYVVGLTSFPHCCYIKPPFRDCGLEEKLIHHAKKVSRDANIENMLAILTLRNDTYRTALENEDAINLTRNMGVNMWTMPNHYTSSTLTLPSEDYTIRDGRYEDLSNIYHLLEELAEMENLTTEFKVKEEEFKRDGAIDKGFYECVVLEHRCRSDDHGSQSGVVQEIVGCMLYSTMYYALIGKAYLLQGLFLKPAYKGKGLGKVLLHQTLKACQKRDGDGYIFMIHQGNKPSESLFGSLNATNMTLSEHKMEWMVLRPCQGDL